MEKNPKDLTMTDYESFFKEGHFFSEEKYRIYRQFTNNDTTESNTEFLKKEFGIGGSAPIMYGLSETHDSKGIVFYDFHCPDKAFLSWNEVQKIISKLISENSYLNETELNGYTLFLEKEAAKQERINIYNKFHTLHREYNDYAYKERKNTLSYEYLQIFGEFVSNSRILHRKNPIYVLPKMRSILEEILKNAPQFKDKVEELKELLKSDVTKPFELTPSEEKDYRKREMLKPVYVISAGDEVYFGGNSYGIISADENEVIYFNVSFPILEEVAERKEFDKKLSENCRNNSLIKYVEA